MRKLIIARSSSLVMMKKNTVIKTRCGKISTLNAHCSKETHAVNIKRVSNFIPLPFRTQWERERERENQRDCHSSLSSGEASYPQEGPEESYSYQHHHHEPTRKTNSRHLSADAPVTTCYSFFLNFIIVYFLFIYLTLILPF